MENLTGLLTSSHNASHKPHGVYDREPDVVHGKTSKAAYEIFVYTS